MIKINLTVSEAMWIVSKIEPFGTIYNKIVAALEVSLGENQYCTVNITRMPSENRISCIKAIRKHTGWSLKQTKEWTDVLTGTWDSYGQRIEGAKEHSLTASSSDVAEQLLRDLAGLDCEGYLS